MRKNAFRHTLLSSVEFFCVDLFASLFIKILIKIRKIAFLHTLLTFIEFF